MKGKQLNVKKIDIMIVFIISIIIGFLICSSLGYLSEGFNVPVNYYAGDDFSILSQIKQLTQEKWIWSTDRLGAPYGQKVFDYSSFFLQNTEYLIIKIISLFTKNVAIIANVLYLCTFILCSISAYCVFRKMRLNYFFAFYGAILFGCMPYLFQRALNHYCLTACYFVPISIYFCYVTYVDDDYLKFDKSILNYKTILVLIACACIANNGIGYYPFFTCFLLCVSGLCKFLKTHKIKSIIPHIKIIVCIVFFMCMSLMPVIVYHLINGANDIAARIPGDAEMYSLKITQLFVPIYSHNIGFVQKFINEYNQNMPLVNENATAYLGIIGCIGFLIGIISLFQAETRAENEKIFLFSRMNIACILFMSVGGFISLLAVLTKVYVMRGFNRISIYIMFCSLFIICSKLQKCYIKAKKKNLKGIYLSVAITVLILGVWDQVPVLINDGSSLKELGVMWNNDDNFIKKIESTLENGDMVFQLPYHKYPESGPVNDMKDYQLLIGYIHSDTLKWSFGGMKGRESDQWNEYVSQLGIPDMIDTIVTAGFKGIYIDKRAYTEEEYLNLSTSIEKIIGVKPLQSTDDNIVFYNLYSYISEHQELLQRKALTIEDIKEMQ